MKQKLSQKLVDTGLRCPEGKRHVEYCDTELPGLYVLVSGVSQQGTYFLRYKANGKTKHRKIGRTTDVTLKDARNIARQLKLEISQGHDPQAETRKSRETPTYAQYMVEIYFPFISARLRNAHGYRLQYDKYLKKAFGNYLLTEITKRQVQEFHSWLCEEQKLAPSTANRYLALIKSSYGTAIKTLEIIDARNPAEGIPMFPEQSRERFLSQAELSRLLPVLVEDGGQIAKIARFLLATGLRRGECLRCEWAHIDIENRVMTIPSRSAKSKKTDSIPLNQAAIQVLQECDRDTRWPFANPVTKKPYNNISKGFRKLMKKAGLEDVTAHIFRHTAASILINSGRTLYDVQRLLRHSSPAVSQRYAHISRQTELEASDTISQELLRAASGNR